MLDRNRYESYFHARRSAIATDLREYLAIRTVSPREQSCFPFLRRYFEGFGARVESRPRHPELSTHPDVSPHPAARREEGPTSLFASFERSPDAQVTTRFNTHIDVVPASPENPDAFAPHVDETGIWGRGACDTKGSLIMLGEALRFLFAEGIALTKHVEVDLPAEEEIGGNGTLSNILYGGMPDETICLEPTGLEVFRGHRGCLTFAVDLIGSSVHMGEAAAGVSAIRGAVSMIASFEELEQELLRLARSEPAFARWEYPLSVNIGTIEGGEWSGSVPERCSIRGDVGFLPTHSLAQIEDLVRAACERALAGWPGGRYQVDFQQGLRNGPCLTGASEPIVTDWAALLGIAPTQVAAWNVSCDARHYAQLMGIPTVIFGCGSLRDAHSAHEYVSWHDLREGAWLLARYLTTHRKSGTRQHTGARR